MTAIMEQKLTAEEIMECHEKCVPVIPVMGYKQFEPNGSEEEILHIQNHLIATAELISCKKIQKLGSLSQALWNSQLQKAEVTHQVGSHWSSMGHTVDKKLYLYPEEALYLLEMSALELTYNCVSLSVQRAYTLLLEPLTDVTESMYRVYSNLVSQGYKVLRHAQSNVLTKYEKQLQIHKAGVKVKANQQNLKKRGGCNMTVEAENTGIKKHKFSDLTDIFPLDTSNRTDDDCLEQMKIFSEYCGRNVTGESNLKITHDIYLSSDSKSSFKKTGFQLPTFRITIHRGNDPMPELKQIYNLFEEYQDDVPIVHAVVFPESITFYTFTPMNKFIPS